MDKVTKVLLPSPNFEKVNKQSTNGRPPLLSPSGMTLLPRTLQPNCIVRHDPTRNDPREKLGERVSPNVQKAAVQFCETCEMELQSEEELRRHRAQHERCPVDGCSYRGHPKVMDKHIMTLHSTGLFDKYKKLSTPEEIAAWRAERKKRYPTIANVEMRQKAREQRQRRGERLEENKSRFGKREDRLRIQKGAHAEQKKAKAKEQNSEPQKRNAKNIQRNNRRKERKLNKRNRASETENLSKEITKVPVEDEEDEMQEKDMFRGTSNLENYKHIKPKNFVKENNPLSSFLGVYDSDGDDDEGDDFDDECGNSSAKGSESVLFCLEYYSPTWVANITKRQPPKTIKSNYSETKGSAIAPNEGDEREPIKTMNQSTACSSGDISKEEQNSYSKEGEKRPNISTNYTADNQTDQKGGSSDEAPEGEREPIKTMNQSTACSSGDIISKEEQNSYSKEGEKRPTISTNYTADNQTDQKGGSSDEAPEEAPVEKASHIPDLPLKKEPPRKRVQIDDKKSSYRPIKSPRTSSGLDYRKVLRKQNTMLEKLLEPDIRHERNVLLQCVRFVCENNFFGVGQKLTERGGNV